jgi:primosomal replication protein N
VWSHSKRDNVTSAPSTRSCSYFLKFSGTSHELDETVRNVEFGIPLRGAGQTFDAYGVSEAYPAGALE